QTNTTLFPYTTLFRSNIVKSINAANSKEFLIRMFSSKETKAIIKDIKKAMSLTEFISIVELMYLENKLWNRQSARAIYNRIKAIDRKSTRLNSSHVKI